MYCDSLKSKKIQKSNEVVWNWNMKFLFLFFSIFSVFLIFHSHFWLSVIIRTMPQRANSNKPSNINKIIFMKSWWNQEITPYTIFRNIIGFEVKLEAQFPYLATFYICKIQTFFRRCWLNTAIDSQKLTDFICVFLI